MLADRRLLPAEPAARVEVRRLLDWFLSKFHNEVTGYLVMEKIYKRFMPAELGGGAPDMSAIRAARTNVRYHLKYIGYLIATRKWLAGDQLTYADLAAAAHLSAADYLGDVPWDEDETAKHWYARVKSRPAFRARSSRTGCPAWRRRSITRTSTSEGGFRRARQDPRLRHRPRDGLGRRAARPRTPRGLAGGGPSRLHGLDGGHGGAARRPADPVARGAQHRALGLNYGPETDPLATLGARDRATISVYARNRDYHDVIKGKLKEAAGFLAARAGSGVKVFVDTAPVMEKPLAQAAGLGWQGKHTVLVSREFGNWLFLGAIFTTAEMPPDAPERDHCGSCRRCLDICPTDAFPAPYRLDARRCISYLTIEHRGHIPPDLRPGIGNRVFGCDDCLAVCPWNKFAQAGREVRLKQREDLAAPPLADLARLDDAAFRARFAGTPIKRTGRDRFVRNVLVAIGNSGDPALAEEAVRLLGDASPPRARHGGLGGGPPAAGGERGGACRRARPGRDGRRRARRMGAGAQARLRRGRRVNLFVFGLGYSASAFVRRYCGRFAHVAGTVRSLDKAEVLRGEGIEAFRFSDECADEGIAAALAEADAVLISIPPGPAATLSSPAMGRSWPALRGPPGSAISPRSASTATMRAPGSTRPFRRRRRANVRGSASPRRTPGSPGVGREAVQVFRLAGIYGPGSNALANLARGTARRIVKSGQVFNRIHVDDIATALMASIERPRPGAVYNVVDDEPAPPQDVVAHAAALLGIPPPPETLFDPTAMSPMAASFYAESKRVSNRLIKQELGWTPLYPSYREGLAALAPPARAFRPRRSAAGPK